MITKALHHWYQSIWNIKVQNYWWQGIGPLLAFAYYSIRCARLSKGTSKEEIFNNKSCYFFIYRGFSQIQTLHWVLQNIMPCPLQIPFFPAKFKHPLPLMNASKLSGQPFNACRCSNCKKANPAISINGTMKINTFHHKSSSITSTKNENYSREH